MNFADSLKKNLNNKQNNADNNIDNNIDNINNIEYNKFTLEKKEIQKNYKRMFPLKLDIETIKKLDIMAKKNGYSRNEVIVKMINFCINSDNDR